MRGEEATERMPEIKINISCDTAAAEKMLKAIADGADSKLRAGLAEAGEMVKGAARGLAPVDTGRLRNSINSTVEGNTAIVGTNVEYAIYQEFGTYKMAAHPFMAPALEACRDSIATIIASKFTD